MSKIARDPLYRRHRFPAEIISHAVWLYFRFPLSLRMVEDMLGFCCKFSRASDPKVETGFGTNPMRNY